MRMCVMTRTTTQTRVIVGSIQAPTWNLPACAWLYLKQATRLVPTPRRAKMVWRVMAHLLQGRVREIMERVTIRIRDIPAAMYV